MKRRTEKQLEGELHEFYSWWENFYETQAFFRDHQSLEDECPCKPCEFYRKAVRRLNEMDAESKTNEEI